MKNTALKPATRDRQAALTPVGQNEFMPLSHKEDNELPLSFYWLLLRRYQWRIITFVLLVTTVVMIVTLALHKQYQSTAILRVDPSSAPTVGSHSSGQSSIPLEALRLLLTEENEITSPAVVRRTIDNLRLDRNPLFAPRDRSGHIVEGALTTAQMNRVIQTVTGGISVNQPEETYLLRVSYRSKSSAISAQIANGLLQSLIQHDYNTRVQALLGSSESMKAQLDSLRAKMERSQAALVHYESSHDVLDPDSKNNIMQSELAQASRALGRAETRRMALEADFQIVQSGDLDALIASDRGQYLLPLEARLIRDRRHLVRMAQVYGPKYPLYLQQQALVRHDQQILQSQERHIAGQITAAYHIARANALLLQRNLRAEKSDMDQFNLKAIRYYALKAASDSYTKLYYELQQRIQDADVAANLHSESLRVISPARPEQIPIYPRPLLTLAVTLVLSSLLAMAAAIAVGTMDKSISSPEQIEQWLHVPALTSLPRVSTQNGGQLSPLSYDVKLIGQHPEIASDPVAPVAETESDTSLSRSNAFREGILGLHSALMLARDQDLHALAVTSAVPGEGKSTVTANLAAAFARLGGRTLLVDADMRKPSIHRQFKYGNRRGLSALLRGQCTLDQVLIPVPEVPNLSLILAGAYPASPSELLRVGLSDLMEQFRSQFDYVLVDCPPVLGFADVQAVANLVDGCIMVVRAGQTERQHVAGALRQLRSARSQILGVVLNGVSADLGSYYKYYSQYHHYYSASNDAILEPEEMHDSKLG